MTPPESDPASPGFSALGLDQALVDALATLGYEEPTPIQRAAIPPLLEGRDLIGQAATGTGKTAAFALPMLQRIGSQRAERARTLALVLVPTRELAMQVAEAVHKYGRALSVRVLPIYGGASMEHQLKALQRGVEVVVATPGRALDHVRRRSLLLDGIKTLVLDEADEMLDMGFADDLEALLDATPKERQTALFSATLPPRIAAIARKHLRDPVTINIAREQIPVGETARVRQTAYIVSRAHKSAALGRVLDIENPASAIVFCRTRTEVDELTETLSGRGFRAEALHGGMSQEQRDRVMKRFRAGTTELLIATDVAARGLDISQLSHVVNYDVPSAPEAYVHRIGRTGRAGREGVAITLAEPREHRQLRNIEALTRQKITITTVPTVADLRSRRLELLRASLREAVIAGGLDPFREVVESLSEEHDVMDVAAAALKLLQAASGETNEVEIPSVVPSSQPRPFSPAVSRPRGKVPSSVDTRDAGAGRKATWQTGRIWVGAGREGGIRAADLVGAITNEAGLESKVIGAVQIGDRYSLVEVPEDMVDEIVAALRNTRLKGKKVTIRRDRA